MLLGSKARLVTALRLKRCTLPLRVIRSATFEGMADAYGKPLSALTYTYLNMVREYPGVLITGACAVSMAGKSMHPGQAGIWSDVQAEAWREIVEGVHWASPGTRLFMQISHAGRQTLEEVTGLPVKGASALPSPYFRQRVTPMSEDEAYEVTADFAYAAQRARRAGFDGVQIQAGHGDLIHQFLSSATNDRTDAFEDTGLLLELVVDAVRDACGPDFPILLKVSAGDDVSLTPEQVIPALERVQSEVDAVEASYGSMDIPFNIVRGDLPLEAVRAVNPLVKSWPQPAFDVWKLLALPFKRRHIKRFTPGYTLVQAKALQAELDVPVIPVGGIHDLETMLLAMEEYGFSAVALSRPFVCEPDLATRLRRGAWTASACTRCNLCAVYCDSGAPLRCHANADITPAGQTPPASETQGKTPEQE